MPPTRWLRVHPTPWGDMYVVERRRATKKLRGLLLVKDRKRYDDRVVCTDATSMRTVMAYFEIVRSTQSDELARDPKRRGAYRDAPWTRGDVWSLAPRFAWQK